MQNGTIRQLKGLAVLVAALAVTLLLVLIGARLLGLVAPFVLALLLSALVRPFMRLLTRRPVPSLPHGLAALVSTLLIVGAMLAFILWIGGALLGETLDFIRRLPEIFPTLQRGAAELMDALLGGIGLLPDGARMALESAVQGLVSAAAGLLSAAAGAIVSWALALPDMIIFIFTTLTATFFFCKDGDRIRSALRPPSSLSGRLRPVRDDLWSGFAGYLRALIILMGVTFLVLLLGFTVLDVRYKLLLALVMALLDALPVLGVALFLLPWAAVSFITTDYFTAIGLLVLLGVILIVRQLIEPKIMSGQMGVHPLLSMLGMYLCYRLMGVWGIILGPVLLIILRSALRLVTRGKGARRFVEEYGLEHSPRARKRSA